jgi:glycosyltransferase involved in cell wall biosynthesis
VDQFLEQVDGAAARERLQIHPDSVAVLLVGSLEPRKGQLEFLQATAEPVCRADSRIRFYLVGGTKNRHADYERACRAAVSQRGLDDRVAFIGYRKDIFAWYAAADIVVLPSLVEGLPRSLLEALAFGRPVVGTDIAGTREVIKHGSNGYLVPNGAHARFARAIMALALDPNLRIRFGRAGRRLAEERFSIEACADGFESIVNDLVDLGNNAIDSSRTRAEAVRQTDVGWTHAGRAGRR